MIISLPVHTAVGLTRALGAFAVVVAVQLFAFGLYLPPVFRRTRFAFSPPQMIISVPVHTVACRSRPSGPLAVLVVVQLSVAGLYLAPVLKNPIPDPPQTIISLPVHTAV